MEEKVIKISTKGKVKNTLLKISGFFIPIFQFVPTASIWFGIMSTPLIGYIIFLFLYSPAIIISDIGFFISFPAVIVIICGGLFFAYTLGYQIVHRKELINKGPYKYIRHPQYLGIIIMTLGFTIVCLYTSPVGFIFPDHISVVIIIWIIEVLAYVFLAKVEDMSLKERYGDQYKDYANSVPFLVPFLKFNKSKPDKTKELK